MNLDLLKIDNILKYVIAFCVGTFIIVYLLKIPNLLTGANKLIKVNTIMIILLIHYY